MAIPPGANPIIIDAFLQGALKEVTKSGEAKGKKLVDQLGGPGAEIAIRSIQTQVEKQASASGMGDIGKALAGQRTDASRGVESARQKVTLAEAKPGIDERQVLIPPSEQPDIRLSGAQRTAVTERQKNVGGRRFEFEQDQAFRRRQELIRQQDAKPSKKRQFVINMLDALSEFQGTKGPSQRRKENLEGRAEQLKGEGDRLKNEKQRLQNEGERLALGFINGTLTDEQEETFKFLLEKYGVVPFLSGLSAGGKEDSLVKVMEMLSKFIGGDTGGAPGPTASVPPLETNESGQITRPSLSL